jgi:hypothetical protein
MWITLFLLLAAHALGDFALQNDYVAKAKASSIVVMLSHSIIHGALTFYVTNSFILGLAETVLHAGIDTAKCRDLISFNVDQALHVACKLGYVALLYGFL